MLNIYSRLYRFASAPKPLENFTTEIFAGILHSYVDIRKEFIQQLLKIQTNEDLEVVETQKFYKIEGEDPNCIVDLVLSNKSKSLVCFIENKVNAAEGFKQLERYNKVHKAYYPNQQAEYVYYCTKYYEEGKTSFTWSDIKNLLKKHMLYPQIKDFVEFLNIEIMPEVEINDNELNILAYMKDVYALEEKLKTILNKLKISFEGLFKNVKIKAEPIFYKKNRSAIVLEFQYLYGHIPAAFESNKFNALMAGFSFEKSTPTVIIWFWTAPGVKQYEEVCTICKTLEFKYNQYPEGSEFVIDKDLEYFFEEALLNEAKLLVWFRDIFEKIKNLITNNPQIHWNWGLK